MREFARIKRLPPYVFNITNELKMAARRGGRGRDRMSMGNPDGPTPKHIVAKLVERRSEGHHGYSVFEGYSAAAPRDLQLVPAPLRRRVRSRQRGDRHHRLGRRVSRT